MSFGFPFANKRPYCIASVHQSDATENSFRNLSHEPLLLRQVLMYDLQFQTSHPHRDCGVGMLTSARICLSFLARKISKKRAVSC